MTARGALGGAALVLACALGCSAQIPAGRLACTTDLECPPEWRCRLPEQRCYPARGGADAGGRVDSGPVACMEAAHCDDGNACTGVEACVDGVCRAGAPMVCDDRDPCTTNLCEGGACRHPPAPDGTSCGDAGQSCCAGVCASTATSPEACGTSCTVCGANTLCAAGRCSCAMGFGDCDGEPGCEANLETDEAHCGICGRSCGAGLSCLEGSCGSCVSAEECVDGLSCTTDSCAGGACSNVLGASDCLIEGACYAAGAANPTNPCQGCDPPTPRAWSNLTGSSCDDGDPSSCGDVCSAGGICRGTVPSCDDGNPCTRDVVACGGASGDCENTPAFDGMACAGPSRGHCCGGLCRDFGNCCTEGSCGFGGVCPGACNGFSCCFDCGGGGSACGA